MFAEVLFGRRDVQAALRIEDVLAPGLVEADGDVVAGSLLGMLAGSGEAPRPQESWPACARQRVIAETGGEPGVVPTAGVKVNFVAVAHEPAREVRNVRLATAASRQNAFFFKINHAPIRVFLPSQSDQGKPFAFGR